MPITMSVNEFKKKTSTTFGERPFALRMADSYLADYHRQVSLNAPHSTLASTAVYGILMNLQDWAQGKERIVVNGKRRYKAYRDRHGMISELERQAVLTDQEIDRAHEKVLERLMQRGQFDRQLRYHPYRVSIKGPPAPPPGKDPLPFVYFGKPPAPPLPPRRKPLPPVALRDSTESFDSSGFRLASLGSFESWDQRSITHPRTSVCSTQTIENMGMANPTLQENHAYHAASAMILIGTRQNVTNLRIRDAARQPKILTGGVLTMGSLAAAINSLVRNNGKEVYYERHCTQSQYFVNILENSSEQNPVLFAVTDNANGPSKVVICRGKRIMWDGQRQWVRYDMYDTSMGIGVANMTMDAQGDMTVESRGQIAHYVAARELGFIKFERYNN